VCTALLAVYSASCWSLLVSHLPIRPGGLVLSGLFPLKVGGLWDFWEFQDQSTKTEGETRLRDGERRESRREIPWLVSAKDGFSNEANKDRSGAMARKRERGEARRAAWE
jgi:hypothetical protein